MNKTKLIVRALDIGYGACKFIRGLGHNGAPLTDSFPSIVKSLPDRSHVSSLARRDTCVITINGQLYETGKDMDAAFDGGSNRTLHENFIDTDEYAVLLKSALYYMDEETIDLLVVGLPVSYMESKSAALRKLILGKHTVNNKTISVLGIHIVPQPIGGFMSLVKQEDIAPNIVKIQRNLLIDPGFFTVDYIAVRGLKEINDLSGSTPHGMHTLLTRICEYISKDFKINYNNISSIDEGLQSGTFTLFGKKVALDKYVKKSIHVFKPAIKEITNKVGDGREVNQIILVGGAAKYLEPLLKKAFPLHPIVLCKAPQLSNVLGFQFIGELKAQDLIKSGDKNAA
jgi:plasmid segregation protein ParM